MKLNLVKVLNAILAEEATVNPVVMSSREEDYRNSYANYKAQTEWENNNTLDLIEHCEKYGWDYSHIKCKPVLSYEKWLAETKAVEARYLVA